MNTEKGEKLRVARPKGMQPATLGVPNATTDATNDATEDLKSLADNVLRRNHDRNHDATGDEKPCNFEGQKQPPKVASEEDFKSQNLAVRIRSEVLKEDVYLVSNEATRDRLLSEGLVCYLPGEILELKGLSPEDLRKIHMVKKVFEKALVIEIKE